MEQPGQQFASRKIAGRAHQNHDLGNCGPTPGGIFATIQISFEGIKCLKQFL